MKKSLAAIFVIPPILASIFIAVHVYYLHSLWKYKGPSKEFVIEDGESFSSINYRLAQEGFISNARVFHHYAKWTGKVSSLKSGVYEVKDGYKMTDILNMLSQGLGILIPVTIPEGKNIYEIADILQEKNLAPKQDFINLAKDPKIISLLNINAPSVEGYLFPETYKFSPKVSAEKIIRSMITLFKKKTATLNFEHPTLSAHEVIILASIVEKETGAKFERKAIAGVFHNRLKKKMRLQSDPTIIYALFPNFDGDIKYKDLRAKTPYNTYQISGLPLGPICNPSLEAIQAVLDPEDHQNLYFVSKNDGTHIFSKTYKEHQKAVDYFQKRKGAKEGKSWRDLKQ